MLVLQLLSLLLHPLSAQSLLPLYEYAPHKHQNDQFRGCGKGRLSALQLSSSDLSSSCTDQDQDSQTSQPNRPQKPIDSPPPPSAASSLHRLLSSYTLYWESLLQQEHQDTVAELQLRRKTYTRSQLEASGLALFDAVASPETELYGEKIVRVTTRAKAVGGGWDSGRRKLRDKFKRGDALLLTPQVLFRGKDVAPRECLVVDVGRDYITLGVGSSWPPGVMEMRKHDAYRVRLDRSLSPVPLRAQRKALDKLRKGRAGSAADLLVRLFYDEPCALDSAEEMPKYLGDQNDESEEKISEALGEAISHISFKPNQSQREAIIWALKRKLSLIRGPPGTGKTRCSALLIRTALDIMKSKAAGNESGQASNPRILAVAHSNGAADVLLQALLQMNVPAVRAGRPASVSPSVQHRTIAALSERVPEVVSLRQRAGDATLDSQLRSSAFHDARRYLNDAQMAIAKSAPVVVTSCIGAQQLMSIIGGNEEAAGSEFPMVVLDEAAQATEPALVCALAAAGAHQVIMVGDTKQLPPTVTTQDFELRITIGVSPMERLLKNGVGEFVLKEQYRMPQALLYHPNLYFYNGVVRCAETGTMDCDSSPPGGFPWPGPNNEPLAYLEIGNDSEVSHNFGGRSNPEEVDLVVEIVQKFIAAGDVKAENIAIITPYNKQVQLFLTEINNASKNGCKAISDVRVGSVDSFQGQETDLVVFSAVRSNLLKELGFLRDARRLNVAITRARRGLILVGDSTVLRTCRHWAALLDSCSDRGCTMTREEYQSNGVEGVAVLPETAGVGPSLSDLE